MNREPLHQTTGSAGQLQSGNVESLGSIQEDTGQCFESGSFIHQDLVGEEQQTPDADLSHKGSPYCSADVSSSVTKR